MLYIRQSTVKRKAQVILLVLASLAVSIFYPLFLATAQSTKVVASEDLGRYWRTTYDILVRPRGARTPIEEKYNLVEANHLSNIWGGITFAQYEAIKGIPDVEVAAPIAMLGYVAVPIPITIPTAFSDPSIKQRVTIDNGVYRIIFDYFDPCRRPFTVYPLLAAVDPEQEAKLVSLDACVIEGDYLGPLDETFEISDWRGVKTRKTAEPGVYATPTPLATVPTMPRTIEQFSYCEIPILLNAHLYTDAYMEVYKTSPNGEEEILHSQRLNFSEQMLDAIKKAGTHLYYPLFPLPQGIEYQEDPPLGKALVLKASPVETRNRPRVGFSSPEAKKAGADARAFIGEGEVAFRGARRGKHYIPVTFRLKGIFDIDKLQHLIGDPNSVPFETYFPPFAVLRYDEEGNPITPVTLKPSLSPYGYLLSPPIALTNMKAAHVLAGEAAISAIRVRVGGTEKLDEAAQAKIEAVASEIYRRTGLDVDIMVGSSPQRILVHIPGDEDAPAIGYVEEYWIKKNVNILIGQTLNKANLAFYAGMLLTCALSMASISFTASLTRTREVGLLKALGWHSRTVFTALLAEALLVGLIAAPLGFSFALGLAKLLDLSLPLKQALLILPLSLTLVLLGSFYPAWNVAGLSPVMAIQRGEVRPKAIGKLSLLSYAARGPLRRPARSLVTLGTVAIFAAFLMLILLAIGASRGYLVGMLLGEHILQRVEGYHYLLIALCSLFSALAVADLVWMNALERWREIGVLKAIGWRSGDVFKAFVLEAAVLGIMGGVLGWAAGTGVFWALYGAVPPSLLWITPVGLAFPTLVSAVAALHPAQRAAQITPARAVRCE
jgi:hypothetical protein